MSKQLNVVNKIITSNCRSLQLCYNKQQLYAYKKQMPHFQRKYIPQPYHRNDESKNSREVYKD